MAKPSSMGGGGGGGGEVYMWKNLTSCSKFATNKLSSSCDRTACPKLSTSLEQAVNNL